MPDHGMAFYTQGLNNHYIADLLFLNIDHTLSILPAEQEQLIKFLVIDDVLPVSKWVWRSITALQLAVAWLLPDGHQAKWQPHFCFCVGWA